jgi:hypothetical protein
MRPMTPTGIDPIAARFGLVQSYGLVGRGGRVLGVATTLDGLKPQQKRHPKAQAMAFFAMPIEVRP